MLFLYLILLRADDDNNTPIPITADLKKGVKVQEVTNTLLYSIQYTYFTIITRINDQTTETLTQSSHIVYIPTILRYLKIVDDVPNRTITITPDATQKLKSAILKPGILVGVTFAILFLIGVVYTSLCRKPQAARRPKPVNRSKRGIDDDFNKAKSKRANARARSASGNRSSTSRRTRSGSTRSQNGSSRGTSRSGSRGGSRGGSRSSRGRTSNRM